MQSSLPRIVITGGLGFIFSHVTEHFVDAGWEVFVLDNLSTGSHPEIADGRMFRLFNKNVADHTTIEFIKRINPEYIIHAAAYSDVDLSIRNPEFVFHNNAVGTLNVFEAARQLPNLKKLLYVSTDEVYGECDHRKQEHEILFPRNPYALSKAMGSLMRISYDNTYPELKDKTTETRFCNVFGPRQDERKIIPAIRFALMTGTPLTVHNWGLGSREWLYVKEIPRVVEQILINGSRTYNVTANEQFSVRELIKLAENVTGKKIHIKNGERPGMDISYEMDATRIRKEFNWEPTHDFVRAFSAYLEGNPL